MSPLVAESRPTAHEYRSVSSLLTNGNEASWLRNGNYVLLENRCVFGSGRHGGRRHCRLLLRPTAPRDLGHPEVDRDGGLAGQALPKCERLRGTLGSRTLGDRPLAASVLQPGGVPGATLLRGHVGRTFSLGEIHDVATVEQERSQPPNNCRLQTAIATQMSDLTRRY